ncbi:hypothetical protein NYA30BAC_01364 [Halomonas sp. NYA30]
METRLLFYQDKHLSPETRWMLLKWSQFFGLDVSVTLPFRELFQPLGMTQRQGNRSLKELKEAGWVTTSPVKKGRGRPLTEYHIDASLPLQLSRVLVPAMPHRPEVERLLAIYAAGALSLSPGANAQANDYASPATRWLMAVLWAHAVWPGIVNNLSYGRLRSLTGMSASGLKSQLKGLKASGLVTQPQRGTSGNALGKKMPSVFVLDLTHPRWGLGDRLKVELLLLPPEKKKSGLIDSCVDALFVAATLINDATITPEDATMFRHARALLPSLRYVEPVADLLVQHYDPPTVRWLCDRLPYYALQLLSHEWDSLNQSPLTPTQLAEQLLDTIKQDFQDVFIWPEQGDRDNETNERAANAPAGKAFDDTPQRDDVVDGSPAMLLIFALAHHLALKLKKMLENAMHGKENGHLTNLRFCLVPIEYKQQQYWCLRGFLPRTSRELSPIKASGRLNEVGCDLAGWLYTRLLPQAAPCQTGEEHASESAEGTSIKKPLTSLQQKIPPFSLT